ncbi:uncharacterized protein LOC123272703 isoform X2 [Cotesia glomerata]|uniref:uncharacterized protein LOC123272703 isoform X2 n=1 Tax=Cotesia glomerata TaxID=32391 RepID=UPI001D032253|nr:uncharacterized protein LOC123272703 isoform X2 [Cotesia glomerata]
MNSKKKPKSLYIQKFRDDWLTDPLLKDWLTSVVNEAGEKLSKCLMCGTTLKNHYSTLKDHASASKHVRLIKEITSANQPKLPFKPANVSNIQQEEAGFALYIAVHSSINVVDHLSEVINHTHKDQDKIKLHRTKCGSIIKNIIALHFFDCLKNDLNNQHYSLLLDESTDVSVSKYLGIIIIYYSNAHKKVISTYLDLVELRDCDAPGTDNASVMVGVNNGVSAILRREVPHLVLVRCLYHSLQIAVSNAAKNFLPRNLEFIIEETYNWFSNSSQRQTEYKDLYAAINDDQNPLKMVRSCQTRWLSIESAVSRIFSQWLELKTHFSIARTRDKSYKAELLYKNYEDDMNYAYIAFLCPILVEVNRVNKMFETKDAYHTKLCDELNGLIDMLVSKITLPTQRVNIFTQKIQDFVDRTCYLGYKFESFMSGMVAKGFDKNQEIIIRERCIQFVVDLINQIKERLPENLSIMQKINRISVDHALSHNKESIVDLLRHFGKDDNYIAKADDQWRRIHLLKWSETKNTNKFWYEVLKFKDSLDNSRFNELASFAICLLTLPHSNADVERLFSTMNLTKTKQRNRMKPDMLKSILTIRGGLTRESKCCNNYEFPADVIKKIRTNEVYVKSTDLEQSSDVSFNEDE